MNDSKQFFDDNMLATHVELLETYLIDVIGRVVSMQQYLRERSRELQPSSDIEFFLEVNGVPANGNHWFVQPRLSVSFVRGGMLVERWLIVPRPSDRAGSDLLCGYS